MKKITLSLDEEEYKLLEQDRGELSQQKYIIRLLKEYQLNLVLTKKENKEKKMNKFLYIDGTGRNNTLSEFTINDFFRMRSYFEGHALEVFRWGRYAEEGSRYSTGSFSVVCVGK